MSKVWLVTGAGSGIGAGTVRAAIAAGAQVVATGRNLDKLRGALKDVDGEKLASVQLDVTDAARCQAATAEAIERFGRVDVLVNNAGYSLLGNYEEFSNAEIEAQFAANFYGVSNMMRAVLPGMRKQRSGQILNISSVAGGIGFPHCGAYSASKFAVEGLSYAVAQEVATFGISITVVEPGFFRTDLLESTNARYPSRVIEDYAAQGKVQDQWAAYHRNQPGDPNRLGAALVTLSQMETPPALFLAGSDTLQLIPPALQARLDAIKVHEALTKSTDGRW